MNLLVKRDQFTEVSTVGVLYVNGHMECYTLEPPKREGDVKPRAIPCGTYDLTIRWSAKHGRLIPHVENVSGFEGIEIHIGNSAKDTEGCLLVGLSRSPDFVGGSHGAFDKLFSRMMEISEPGEVRKVGSITYQEE